MIIIKNDDKIVELLADSLKEQDQQSELLNVLVQGQAQLLLTAQETNKRLDSIENSLEELSELRREIDRIKRHIGLD